MSQTRSSQTQSKLSHIIHILAVMFLVVGVCFGGHPASGHRPRTICQRAKQPN